jgi:hypothetical protein
VTKSGDTEKHRSDGEDIGLALRGSNQMGETQPLAWEVPVVGKMFPSVL